VDVVGNAIRVVERAEVGHDPVVPEERVGRIELANNLTGFIDGIGVAPGAAERSQVDDGVAWTQTVFERFQLQAAPRQVSRRGPSVGPVASSGGPALCQPTDGPHRRAPFISVRSTYARTEG